jgi:hypothetical protein
MCASQTPNYYEHKKSTKKRCLLNIACKILKIYKHFFVVNVNKSSLKKKIK